MTTESTQVRRPLGLASLLGAASCALGSAILLLLVALLVSGGAAAGAVAGGAVLAVAVFLFGALTVSLVATVLPSASLMVALLTYVLQLLLMTVVLAALASSTSMLDGDRGRWLAGGVVAAALTWSLAQLVLAIRRRIPVYDLELLASNIGETRVSVSR
jgi:ATP synthase protein I